MSSIDPAVASVMAAKDAAMKTQISVAVASKQIDAEKQIGDAVNQMLAAAAQLSKAIGKGLNFDAVG